MTIVIKKKYLEQKNKIVSDGSPTHNRLSEVQRDNHSATMVVIF